MNKVILIGRLTKDPDLSYAAGTGTAVCRFTLAVTRPFKRDETDFIRCVAFNKTAETIGQYLTKGRQIAIAGRIQTGSYDAQDGIKRYTTDVVVESFEFIGSGQGQQNNGNVNQNTNWNTGSFDEDMTPVDDGDMPF
ncbi:single-stranded DNA-binding protein [Clostridium isatidis]|uniref:single-stranded DNA-binding protein n=1 Tax=Clostridium isatidis TaxID=182773 RepID=UPI003AACFAE8